MQLCVFVVMVDEVVDNGAGLAIVEKALGIVSPTLETGNVPPRL